MTVCGTFSVNCIGRFFMKLVFVLPTTALCFAGVVGILSLITLAQSLSQQPTPATPIMPIPKRGLNSGSVPIWA